MDGEVWTIKRCLDWTTGYLEHHQEEHPRVAAEWLLCAATGITQRVGLYLSFDRQLTPEELAVMRSGIQRRVAGEPLQYIVGETSFRTLTVHCASGVLIPRPETELLVDIVLKYLDKEVLGATSGAVQRKKAALPWNAEIERALKAEQAHAAQLIEDVDSLEEETSGEPEEVFGHVSSRELSGEDVTENQDNVTTYKGDVSGSSELDDLKESTGFSAAPVCAHVLEVGCGTGCISLSLAAERAGQVTCVATDIEPRAVELAERNRTEIDISPEQVAIRLGDLVEPVRKEEYGTFDVLVSNPPYIPTAVLQTLPREVVSFEPGLALDGGTDGLAIYRRLVATAPLMLKPGGLFACELFEDATEPAAAICRAAHFDKVSVVPDLTGRPRFVVAYMPIS